MGMGKYDQMRKGLSDSLKISWLLADSGFGEDRFLSHLEGENQSYVVTLRLSASTQRTIYNIKKWHVLGTGLEVAESIVQLSTWQKPRRLFNCNAVAWPVP